MPQVTQPIFTVGRLKNNLRLSEAERQDAQVAYEKSISTAFRRVSDGLIAHQRTRESRVEQQKLVNALQDRKRFLFGAQARTESHPPPNSTGEACQKDQNVFFDAGAR